MTTRRLPFTVLEVLVAVAILALAVGAALAVAGQATARLLRAEARLVEARALGNAAEWFLLTAPGGSACPDRLLPAGWQARCRVRPLQDARLPSEARAGWTLVEYGISVEDARGRQRGQVRVAKLLREEDL